MDIEKLFLSGYIKSKNIKKVDDILYSQYLITKLVPIFLEYLDPIKYKSGTFPFRSQVEGQEAVTSFLETHLLKVAYVRFQPVQNTEKQKEHFYKIKKLLENTIFQMLDGLTDLSKDPEDQEIFILKKFNKLKYNEDIRSFLDDTIVYKIEKITEKEGLDHLKKIYIQMIGSLFTLLFIIDMRLIGFGLRNSSLSKSILEDIGANPFLVGDILEIFLKSFSFGKSPKKLRKLGCDKIDFLGQSLYKKKKTEKLLSSVVDKVADRNAYQGDNYDINNITDYCKNRNWLYNNKVYKNCQLSKIPLSEMVFEDNFIHRQYVLGRMKNLEEYYKCHYFYTLDSEDWDDLYQLNDLFIYCAQESEENVFPIRIVTDPKGGIKSKDELSGISDYDKNIITLPHLLKQYENINIVSREICQLSKYFKMGFYQSIDYPNIFFATKKSKIVLAPYIKKYNLRKVGL